MKFIVKVFLASGLMVFGILNLGLCQNISVEGVGDTTRLFLDSANQIAAISVRPLYLTKFIKSDPLSNLPLLESKVYVRSQGNGQIASVSFRGLSSRQTDLRWGGFSLQSPTGISTDFGQIPWQLFDGVYVSPNSQTTGENGIGGAIDLSVRVSSSQPLFHFSTSFGSFGQQNNTGVFYNEKEKSSLKVGYSSSSSQNNFLLKTGLRQEHSETSSKALIADYNWENNGIKNELKTWFQRNQISIPASLIEGRSTQKRLDHDVRISHRVAEKRNKWDFALSNLLNFEMDQFEDSLRDFQSLLEWITFKNRIGFARTLGEQTTIGILLTRSNGWLSSPQIPINSSSQFINSYSLNYQSESFSKMAELELSVKFIQNGKKVMMMPLIEIKKTWKSRTILNVLIERRGRFPSLSDLYWYQPGFAKGNPGLNPEEMWVQEISLKMIGQKLKLETKIFHQEAKSMINWLNVENGISIPNNTEEIRSYGVELNGEWKLLRYKKNNVSLNVGYQWNKATQIKTGNAALFTPVHKGDVFLLMKKEKNTISIQGLFQSEQNLNDQGTNTLDGYTLFNVSYTRQLPEITSELSFRAQNITNQYYQLIPFYPMPGRSFHITYNYKINKKNDD